MLTRPELARSWQSWLSYDGTEPQRWWLPLLWTFLFCAAIALAFTLVGLATSRQATNVSNWLVWYQNNFLISLVIGYLIHFEFALGRRWLGGERIRRWKPWQRTVYFSFLPLVGVAIGWPLALSWVLGLDIGRLVARLPTNALVSSFVFCLFITFVFHQFFAIKTRQIEAERRAAEARLRLLQAQIEPHFLFNTLANVVSLIETDGPRARAMLESFVDYLRASLSGLGSSRHTLGEELRVVDAYLRVIQTRMDDRLAFSIEVPEALRGLRVPALSVQPLVENAVVHGLEPEVAGGRVRVVARRDGDTLVVSVGDDGAGLREPAPSGAPARGTGTALANIRERLRQAHGDAASLALAPASPRGTVATLRLPADDGTLEPALAAAAAT